MGICRYPNTGSNICIIKVPKNPSGVTLIAKRDLGVATGDKSLWNGELRLRLKNVDGHPVEIGTFDRDTITRLNPGESVEVTTKSAVTSEAYVGYIDTSESGAKLAIQIVASGIAGEEVRIVGDVGAL
ncbi:MAG: hypothetical protein NT154_15790 [Verrucomicrobia bacterium]|nr:hypothetical protein [Verrucomicrobiota bacterium]